MEKKHQINLWYAFAAIFLILMFQGWWAAQSQIEDIPYSEFETLLKAGRIAEVAVRENTLQGVLKEPRPDGARFFRTTRVDPEMAALLAQYGVDFKGEIESTFKKSDIDQLKAFVTKKNDELRLPYDRAFTTYQRRTAFYASVNAREFLTDTSGNRRFWVVPVTGINADHGLDMQQVWAEVKETLYTNTNFDWYLTKEEREMLQDSNEYYRTQSSVEDLILEHVHFASTQTKPVQMTKLLRDLGISQPRMPDIKDASRVLSAHGLEPRKSNGKKVYDLDYTKVEVGNADKFSGGWS